MPNVGFEGVVASNNSGPVPGGYDGFDWSEFSAIGKAYVKNNANHSGFHNALHGKVVGSMGSLSEANVNASIFAEHAGDTFAIRSGTFASAWNKNVHVTFHAFLSGVEVGTLSVVLDQQADTIHFGKHFRHIDELTITSSGGVDADPHDGSSGPFIAVDDLDLTTPTAVTHAVAPELANLARAPMLPVDHAWHGLLP